MNFRIISNFRLAKGDFETLRTPPSSWDFFFAGGKQHRAKLLAAWGLGDFLVCFNLTYSALVFKIGGGEESWAVAGQRLLLNDISARRFRIARLSGLAARFLVATETTRVRTHLSECVTFTFSIFWLSVIAVKGLPYPILFPR